MLCYFERPAWLNDFIKDKDRLLFRQKGIKITKKNEGLNLKRFFGLADLETIWKLSRDRKNREKVIESARGRREQVRRKLYFHVSRQQRDAG